MNLRHWIRHPREAIIRLRYYAWEKLHPDCPWLCPGTVRFCAQHLNQSMTGLEFGSGRSTLWFARRMARLTSVENDVVWHAKVAKWLAAAHVTNVDYRLVPLDLSNNESDRGGDTSTPAYVRVADDIPDRSLDLVIIDGYYRPECIRRTTPKLKPGGLFLVDDVNFWPSLEAVSVPAEWTIVDDSTNGLKRGVIWRAV